MGCGASAKPIAREDEAKATAVTHTSEELTVTDVSDEQTVPDSQTTVVVEGKPVEGTSVPSIETGSDPTSKAEDVTTPAKDAASTQEENIINTTDGYDSKASKKQPKKWFWLQGSSKTVPVDDAIIAEKPAKGAPVSEVVGSKAPEPCSNQQQTSASQECLSPNEPPANEEHTTEAATKVSTDGATDKKQKKGFMGRLFPSKAKQEKVQSERDSGKDAQETTVASTGETPMAQEEASAVAA